MVRGRKWILDHGGVTNILSWGKAWLSVLWPFFQCTHTHIYTRVYNFWSEPISSYVDTWCLWLVWMQPITSGVLDASFFSTHTSRFAKFKFYSFLRLHKGYDSCVNNVIFNWKTGKVILIDTDNYTNFSDSNWYDNIFRHLLVLQRKYLMYFENKLPYDVTRSLKILLLTYSFWLIPCFFYSRIYHRLHTNHCPYICILQRTCCASVALRICPYPTCMAKNSSAP